MSAAVRNWSDQELMELLATLSSSPGAALEAEVAALLDDEASGDALRQLVPQVVSMALELAEKERGLREEIQRGRRLQEQLAHLQSLISHRARLEDVLESIVAGASALVGGEMAMLRLIDGDDPTSTVPAAVAGSGSGTPIAGRVPRCDGMAGRAIEEASLVAIEDDPEEVSMQADLLGCQAQAAMAVPVHEHGTVVGGLVVMSHREGRRYTDEEREMVAAFAEHASLALAAARTVDTMRHAYNDFLTGLANRGLFIARLEQALSRAAREGNAVTILFLDIDRFKLVNDRLGHAAGDELLVAVAERLRGCLRHAETAARLGGDEFAVLLEETGGTRDGVQVARNVMQAFRKPFTLQGHELLVSASLGVATGHDVGADELLREADEAMYRAKRQGKGRYEVYEPGMVSEAAELLEHEAELQRTLERGDLLLHYQPIVDLSTERVVAVEALVRAHHPQRGLVPPSEFIPLAERTGQILDIGRWVLEEACGQAATWQSVHPMADPLRVSVNLSGWQLQQPHIVEEVAEVIRRTRLEPGSLLLEITESVLMDDAEAIVAKLAALRKLGVRLAIDDFGTGYSSLRYLQRFPIDMLKVAKPFVDGLAGGSGESPVARAIVDLSRALGLGTIAEGIEEGTQALRLRGLGCELGQGYLYARPLEARAIGELLADQGESEGEEPLRRAA